MVRYNYKYELYITRLYINKSGYQIINLLNYEWIYSIIYKYIDYRPSFMNHNRKINIFTNISNETNISFY